MTASLNDEEKAILDDRFNCFGHFYDIYHGDIFLCNCRSTLEIINREINLKPNELYTYPLNAIFIMMNPGASKPVGSPGIPVKVQKIEISNMNIVFAREVSVCLNQIV